MKFLVLIFLLLPTTAHAFDSWTWTDTGFAVAFLAVDTVDWLQTRDIKNHPGVKECNGMLGSHPTDREIDRYFAAAAIGTIGLSIVLPQAWRRVLLGGMTLGAISTTVNNHRVGLEARMEF